MGTLGNMTSLFWYANIGMLAVLTLLQAAWGNGPPAHAKCDSAGSRGSMRMTNALLFPFSSPRRSMGKRSKDRCRCAMNLLPCCATGSIDNHFLPPTVRLPGPESDADAEEEESAQWPWRSQPRAPETCLFPGSCLRCWDSCVFHRLQILVPYRFLTQSLRL